LVAVFFFFRNYVHCCNVLEMADTRTFDILDLNVFDILQLYY